MEYIAYRKADLDLSVISNDTLNASFQLIDETDQPVNLASYTGASMMVKSDEYSLPILTLTSSNNSIDLSQLALGIIKLYSPILSLNAGQYLYDVELRNNNTIETIAGGYFNVSFDITR